MPEGVPWIKKGIAEAEHSDTRESFIIQAFAYHSLAYALTPSDPEAALNFSRKESEIFTRLTQRDPEDAEAQNGLADSYNATGGALVRRNRLEEALALFKQGAEVMERLVARHPNDVMMRRDLLNAYVHVGDALGNPARRNLGDRHSALPYYRKAQAIGESLLAADTSNRLAQMDALEVTWRMGVVIDSPADALAILDSARESALKMAGGKELNTTLGKIVATIDEFRGWRLIALQKPPEAVSAFQTSFDMAQMISKRDRTDSNANSVMLLDRSGMCPTLASMGRREEALACARHAMAQADELAANGPGPRVHGSLYSAHPNVARCRI